MNPSSLLKKTRLLSAALSGLLLTAGPAAAELPQYTVVNLSGWWNAGAYNAVSLNDLGEILIRSTGAEKEFALVRDGVRTASLTNPPAGYYQFDGGKGLNNAGQALAELDSLTSEGVGIADMRTGVIAALPDPPQNGDDDLNPRMSANASKVVIQGGSQLQPCLYDTTGGTNAWISLGGLVPGGIGRAFGVSDSGTVVGRTTGSGGGTVPFIWTAGAGMEAITDHGTPVYGQATAINERGLVTGTADGRSFVFDSANGELTWLTPEASQSAADINNAGLIIGQFNFGPVLGIPGDAAWIATAEDGWMHLTSLIPGNLESGEWSINDVLDINDDGWILASAYNYRDKRSSQVLLRPVPEPGAAVLLMAFGGLGFLTRRQRRADAKA